MHVTFEMNIQPDQPSPNGRIYSKEICDKMIEDIKKLKYVNYGNIQHNETSLKGELDIKSIVAEVEDVHYDEGKIMIESIILDTPHGDLVKDLLKEHSQSSFTCVPAGFGSVYKEGDQIKVANDYEIKSVNLIPKERQS